MWYNRILIKMLFWLTTAIFICTTTALDSQGRDLAANGRQFPESAGNGDVFIASSSSSTGKLPILSLNSHGNFVGFTRNFQNLGNGVTMIEIPYSDSAAVIVDLPCGGFVSRVNGVHRPRPSSMDKRCGQTTNFMIRTTFVQRPPTNTVHGHQIIAPCGGYFFTREETEVTIYVDVKNCARDPQAFIDGIPEKCFCGCNGTSSQGTFYSLGQSPSCNETFTKAGGSTIIVNQFPDYNANPLGLFPFINVNNALHAKDFGYESLHEGLNTLLKQKEIPHKK